jgi:SnoaL-like polyketide cyclase.
MELGGFVEMEGTTMDERIPATRTVVDRLMDATRRRDLDGLVDCFDPDVVSDTPAHPARSFRGRESVRENWTQILRGVPDLHQELLGFSGDDRRAWCEWAWDGTRADGTPFGMRGVTIFDVAGDRITGVRFHMEPLERDGADGPTSVRQAVTR